MSYQRSKVTSLIHPMKEGREKLFEIRPIERMGRGLTTPTGFEIGRFNENPVSVNGIVAWSTPSTNSCNSLRQ